MIVLHIEAALQQHDPVDLQQARRGLVDGLREQQHLDRALHVLQRPDHHQLSLAGELALELRKNAADALDGAVRHLGQIGDLRVGVVAQRCRHAGKGVLGDVEAEHLLLRRQQLGPCDVAGGELLAEMDGGREGGAARFGVVGLVPGEQGELAGILGAAVGHGGLDDPGGLLREHEAALGVVDEEGAALDPDRVECPRPGQRLHDLLVEH